MRAREPDQEGYVERDGVKVGYEVFGNEQPDRAAATRLVDRAVADLEGAGAVPGPARAGDHVRPTRERAFGPPRGAAAYAAEEFVADALDVLDATGTEQAVLVELCRAATGTHSASPPTIPSACSAGSRSGRTSSASGSAARPADEAQRGSTTTSASTRGGGATTGTRGCATSAGSPSSSSASCCRSRTRPSRSRTRSPGRWTSSRRRSSRPRRRPSDSSPDAGELALSRPLPRGRRARDR